MAGPDTEEWDVINNQPMSATERQRAYRTPLGEKLADAIIKEQNMEPWEIDEKEIVELNHQLHAARYAYHKQIKHKYMVMSVMTQEEGAEMYRLAMLNYDRLIEDAAGGSLTEADEADMAKGFAP